MFSLRSTCITLSFCALAASSVHAADLKVEVASFTPGGGQLLLALYDSADGFLKRSVRVAAAPASGSSASIVLNDLPAGEYAFALFQDANGNGQLDKNMMGMPTESFTFSNDAMGNMGPPSFAQAKLTLTPAGATTVVHLR